MAAIESVIPRRILEILFGIGLFCAVVYLLTCSDILTLLEGDNPDGSSSITWHSLIAAGVLVGLCQILSVWSFRRGKAAAVSIAVAVCAFAWYCIAHSTFAFAWEPHQVDGTFPLTWRSDVVILGFLVICSALTFAVHRVIAAIHHAPTSG